MTEKRYYWLKLPRDFFKRHDIKYIETLPNGREIAYFYLKLMTESIDHEGELRFSPKIPYTEEMLASVTDTNIETVKTAMQTLKDLDLISVSKNGTIKLEKVASMIGFETKWAEKNRHLIDLKLYSEAKSFLFDYEEEKDFDILLLDVEMPGITGIELAKTVRQDNTTVQIVFITGFYDYFSDGFDVSALHYLIKPVDERKLFPVLDKAAGNLSYRQRSVLLATADADIKVSLADITYIEAEKVHIIVHSVGGDYRTRISMAKFMEQLDDTFIKVHRSFVVGLKYVKKITRTEITMQGGETVPISRGMYDEVHAALVKHL